MIECSDAKSWLRKQLAKSLDLIFFSPPYEDCRRLPDCPPPLKGQAWVDDMVETIGLCVQACKGLVCCVVEGKTRQRKYSATPFLLVADLHRAGFNLLKPGVFGRDGIPGSGGNDKVGYFLKNRWEPIIYVSSSGRLPYANVEAIGSPPKYGPGGACSNRLGNGMRAWSCGLKNGDVVTVRKAYKPPKIANPGNLFIGKTGKGHMGDLRCHKNEAPFPEWLVKPHILAFCPPGGTVGDPYCGSGTTLAVAEMCGRIGVGCDIRQSQVDLANERLEEAKLKGILRL